MRLAVIVRVRPRTGSSVTRTVLTPLTGVPLSVTRTRTVQRRAAHLIETKDARGETVSTGAGVGAGTGVAGDGVGVGAPGGGPITGSVAPTGRSDAPVRVAGAFDAHHAPVGVGVGQRVGRRRGPVRAASTPSVVRKR